MNVHGYQYHTIAETFELICSNENPWMAIGNFLNDWWYYTADQRVKLIETPLPLKATKKAHQWAAFCAAMIETLCERCDVPYPNWITQEHLVLPGPWFYDKDKESRARLLAIAPTPFKKRNVYVSNRVLSGKWDLPSYSVLNSKDSIQTGQSVRV